MLMQYAIPPLPNSFGISSQLESLAREFDRLQNEIMSSAGHYFEVKGDLIVFKNTDDLAKNIHAVTVKLNEASQMAVKTLNNYAAQVRSMDGTTLAVWVLTIFMGLRPNDPSMLQLLGLLAAGEMSLLAGPISSKAELMLSNLATVIQEKSKPLATAANNRTALRLGVWAALKNNSFNWRTQQFQSSGTMTNLLNKYKLNPALANAKTDIESLILGQLIGAALSRAGLPGPAVQPTVVFLVAAAMNDRWGAGG